MVMEVIVNGTDIDPAELKKSNWVTKVTKKVKELQQQGQRESKAGGSDAAETAAVGTERSVKVPFTEAAGKQGHKGKLTGKQLAEKSIASNLPRLPHADYKVIVRPKEGLALTKLSIPVIGGLLRLSAAIEWTKGQEEDRVVMNDKQGTITYSTPKEEDAVKMLALRRLKIEGKEFEVTTYMAAPDNCSRGVVHGLDPRLSEEELETGFSHRANPPIIGVRRMGNSGSVIITFAGPQVPRWMLCFGAPMKCYLYRKRYEVCFKCGDIGHRSDVCNNPTEMCRGCGKPSPTNDHRCEPKCKLCGKEHMTGDKRCKALFRTPYIVKRRQWERKLEAEARKQEEEKNKKTGTGTPRASRRDQSRGRSTSKSTQRSKSRNRSESFPRLPALRTETSNTKDSRDSGSVRATSGNPKTKAPKVGWVDGAAQDANAEILNALKEQNRILMEQNAELKKQLDEVKTALTKKPEQEATLAQAVSPPPAKKMKSKQNEEGVNYENRIKNLETECNSIKDMLKSILEQVQSLGMAIEQMTGEIQLRDKQIKWLCGEAQKKHTKQPQDETKMQQ